MKTQNKHNQPLASVIMPVYNAGGFLVDAVNSILKQTHQNFEFIIVDDRSTDDSWSKLKKLALHNKKIKLIRNEHNLGISKSLNKAISQAKGDYLIRMDADDITNPNRIEKQVRYFKEHQDVALIGTQCHLIDAENNIIGAKNFPLSHKEINEYLFKFNPIQHPTIAINRILFPKKFIYYDLGFDGAEDLNLIFKVQRFGKVQNMKEYLHSYRIHNNNSSLHQIKHIFWKALESRVNGIVTYGYKPSLRSIYLTLAQTIIITLLPESIILKLYIKLRSSQLASSLKKIHDSILYRISLKTKVAFGL